MREGKVADVRTSLRMGGGKGCVNRPPFWVEKRAEPMAPSLKNPVNQEGAYSLKAGRLLK